MPESREERGAALVVGGGIAGLQASLDLAGMGYTSYLVGESGTLSPVEDAVSCLLSHKLSEADGHPWIEMLGEAEVVEIAGDPGEMKVRVRRKDRPGDVEELLEVGAVILAFDRPISPDLRRLAESLGVTPGNQPLSPLDPLATPRPGIYACGLTADKDWRYLLLEASAAAGSAAADLEKTGLTRNPEPGFPEIPDRSMEPPRIGLFVCECASRIGGAPDAAVLIEHSADVPFLQHSRSFPLACRPDALSQMGEAIRENRLNRVVVACTATGAGRSVFLRTLQQANIDSHLFHHVRTEGDGSPEGTEEAKDRVRTAVLKAALQQPRTPSVEGVVKTAMVVGGGLAGVTAALSVAEQGYRVHLVEKSASLDAGGSPSKSDVQDFFSQAIRKLQASQLVDIHLGSEVLETGGYLGSFFTRVKTPRGEISLSHGAAVLSGDESQATEREGFFMGGSSGAHRPVHETIVAAGAAAVRASAILSRDRVLVRGVAPAVSRGKCAACLTCVRTCPCGVPYVDEKGFAQIDPAICRGCGTCMTECPGKAISLQQFTDEQMRAKLEMYRCSDCGQPYLTLGRLEYLKRKLSAEDLQPLDRQLCPVCSRGKGAEGQVWVT